MPQVLHFPPGFLWGTATAAYQVEGGAEEGGRKPSIWDTFCHTPGKVFHGDTGDIACDHYHRWEQDVGLMSSLGLSAYRFSVSWSRAQPEGSGPFNQVGLDFYRRLLDTLGEHGITPAVTLYHWDLPQALEDKGGWTERETAKRFADYASGIVNALGDRAKLWITLNEPWVSSHVGYGMGRHAPGKADLTSAVRAAHHLLLGHGLAAGALRSQVAAGSQVGIALNLTPTYAASAEDGAVAELVDAYANRWFLDPIFLGTYPDELAQRFYPVTGDLHVQPGDLATISSGIDFLGVNYYLCRHVAAASAVPDQDYGPYPAVLGAVERPDLSAARTGRGWPVQPGGLTEILVRLSRDYGDIALYVTENGAAYPDYVGPDGDVKDPERIDYLEQHLRAAHAAIAAGVDLRGYFCWTLMDNFEWETGYSQRFGLVWVDFRTQERTPKASALWFSAVARDNAVPAGDGV